jgi:predicted metal-dependent enzyme (double-stranded beta helix superfamily)
MSRAPTTIAHPEEKPMASARLPVFEKFIGDLRAIWAADTENQRRMERAKPLLEVFVKEPTLKAHAANWPSTEGGKNLLLHVDADYHFVVNAVVRVPGRTGSVHDHADAWVLYGVLDGSESLERYDRVDDGSRPGFAEVRLSSVTTGTQGKVDLVPPHAIHAEQGGPTRSVAIIVRSQKLGQGTVLQRRYDPKAKTVVEQYGPTQVPFDLSADLSANLGADLGA